MNIAVLEDISEFLAHCSKCTYIGHSVDTSLMDNTFARIYVNLPFYNPLYPPSFNQYCTLNFTITRDSKKRDIYTYKVWGGNSRIFSSYQFKSLSIIIPYTVKELELHVALDKHLSVLNVSKHILSNRLMFL